MSVRTMWEHGKDDDEGRRRDEDDVGCEMWEDAVSLAYESARIWDPS